MQAQPIRATSGLMDAMLDKIRACTLCADRFAKTETAHAPRPVLQVSSTAKILIAGQAPGQKVHLSGRPFTDPSGDRLRDWMQIDKATFYDSARIAILPMAFCFPGYNAKGSDLPPPAICAKTWRKPVMELLEPMPLTLLIGGYAMKWHLGGPRKVTQTVADWKSHAPKVFPLPHPSWRNNVWIRKNDWFEETLVHLKERVKALQ